MKPRRADGGPSRQTLIPFPAVPDALSGSQSPRISRPRASGQLVPPAAHAVTEAPSWGGAGGCIVQLRLLMRPVKQSR